MRYREAWIGDIGKSVVRSVIRLPEMTDADIDLFSVPWDKGARSEAWVVLAMDGRKVVGWSAADRSNEIGMGFGKCDGVAGIYVHVHPQYRGKGIGRSLGERALNAARDRGWEVAAFPFDETGVAFFESLGVPICAA